jgi:hypothetical protein
MFTKIKNIDILFPLFYIISYYQVFQKRQIINYMSKLHIINDKFSLVFQKLYYKLYFSTSQLLTINTFRNYFLLLIVNDLLIILRYLIHSIHITSYNK